MIDELLLGPWHLKLMSNDVDLRHVFLENAKDRNRCVICLKEKGHSDHVSEEVYAQLHNENKEGR